MRNGLFLLRFFNFFLWCFFLFAFFLEWTIQSNIFFFLFDLFGIDGDLYIAVDAIFEIFFKRLVFFFCVIDLETIDGDPFKFLLEDYLLKLLHLTQKIIQFFLSRIIIYEKLLLSQLALDNGAIFSGKDDCQFKVILSQVRHPVMRLQFGIGILLLVDDNSLKIRHLFLVGHGPLIN